MNRNLSHSLWLGMLLAFLAVAIAAASAGEAPAVAAPLSPTATFVALREGTAPQQGSTPEPTNLPTPLPLASAARPTPTATHPPTALPLPSAPSTSLPQPTVGAGQIIGHSVQGRPILAHRIGQGTIKIVLIGDIHGGYEANTHVLAQQLLAHFQAHASDVPPQVSLWIVPTMNPDGLATGHRWNANEVDLNRNADTSLDGCAGNDWSPDTVGYEGPHPGAGGAFPFSEPESRAMRDFLDDAWIAVFYHSAAGAIYVDTCQRHAPTARLAQVLSEAIGYPIPAEGWTSYPITGDFGDYLAGEGVAAVTLELTDHEEPEFERNLAGVQALLAAADDIVRAEITALGADYVWLSDDNVGTWRDSDNSFLHPLALDVVGKVAYLLDGGRVLALNLDDPASRQVILAPGDDVENVRVIEPLDLAALDDELLVLDRAGDVYRHTPTDGTWSIERYDRPERDTYDHYFVALTTGENASYLLETTHEQVWRFASSTQGAGRPAGTAWIKLPQSRDVDLSVHGTDLYVLTRALNAPAGKLLRFHDGQLISAFQPNLELMHPRQVVATDRAVYILDRAGRRLLAFHPESGDLLTAYQFSDRRSVSAIWADPSGHRLLLAAGDALYFYDEPHRQATIQGDAASAALADPQPHDLRLLESLRGLAMPIDDARLTTRDFQMPGAPRHYRLGVHEGIDFYSQTAGVPITNRTPVRAIADGVVIRALVDYEPLTAGQADAWAARCRELGYTPPEVLDGYRGRQVWIDHGNGLVSRYAHLSAIDPAIAEGVPVSRGQVIATVGNSGTPASIRSQTVEVHLHLEIWLRDHFLGQFLRPIEAREYLAQILR